MLQSKKKVGIEEYRRSPPYADFGALNNLNTFSDLSCQLARTKSSLSVLPLKGLTKLSTAVLSSTLDHKSWHISKSFPQGKGSRLTFKTNNLIMLLHHL
jgi:hypothetical protein